jgi:hypothetical protein
VTTVLETGGLGKHRGETGASDLGRDVRVTVDGDEPRCDRIHGDAEGSELARPGAAEADLCALRRDVGGSPWRGSVHDLGVDLDDAPPAPQLHRGKHRPAEPHRALDEELELRAVVLPRHLDQRRMIRRRSKLNRLSAHHAAPGRCPRARRGVVHEDKISWPTRGPNVDSTIGSTMRSGGGVRAKNACK